MGNYGLTQEGKLVEVDYRNLKEDEWNEIELKSEVSGISGIKKSYGGYGNYFVIDGNGDAYAWGSNSSRTTRYRKR